jgi:hypothetical protein
MGQEIARPSADLPCVFLFVGHFNDIDHLSPVAYKLWETGRARPIVLVTDPGYDIDGDYRLQFLKDHCGARVRHALWFEPPNVLIAWLTSLAAMLLRGGPVRGPALIAFRAMRKLFYGRRWAGKLLVKYRPAALVFEWAHPASGMPGAFVFAGKARGIPSLSLPHGMFIFTNDRVTREEQRRGPVSRDYVNLFDRAVYQSRLHADRSLQDGVRPEKIAVLGSARYCDEWQRLNLEIQPVAFTPEKGQGCTHRAVFMLPQWNYNADKDAAVRALRRLGAESWLHLAVKPHTRELAAKPQYLQDLDALPNVEIVGDVPSTALVQWADSVIVSGSSIALEVLLQGKVHINPVFIDENSTVFEEEGAEWTVRNDDELVDALRRLANGEKQPYGEAQVASVVRRLVLGDSDNRDVLNRYVEFVLGGWRTEPAPDEPVARSRQV